MLLRTTARNVFHFFRSSSTTHSNVVFHISKVLNLQKFLKLNVAFHFLLPILPYREASSLYSAGGIAYIEVAEQGLGFSVNVVLRMMPLRVFCFSTRRRGFQEIASRL